MNASAYKRLIQDFLNHDLSVQDFESQYLSSFKSESIAMEKKLFLILEDLFENIDAYSPIWTIEDESPFRLTEASLRREAVHALSQIEEYIKGE